MQFSISQRGFVRFLSFALAALAVMSGLIWVNRQSALSSRRALEYHYLQAAADLAGYVQNIDSTLQKAAYAGTPAMLSRLSAKLSREAGYAKASLDALPVEYLQLQNANKLLSQVGDYCVSLANGYSGGTAPTAEQRRILGVLRQYCGQMLQEVYALNDAARTGSLRFAAETAKRELGDAENAAPSVAEGFSEFEEGFTAYPSLIYDGPFSDHILQQEPEYRKGAAAVSQESARQKAARLLGIGAGALSPAGDEEGKMPSYGFTAALGDATAELSLTKQGGFLCYLLRHDSGETARPERTVSAETAFAAAKSFLNRLSLPPMRSSYYEIGGNVMIINFAAVENGAILYPDLVKVGISLVSGDIVSFDARGFLMNYKERKPAPSLTQEEARQSVSPLLSIERAQLCVIPSEGLNESLCWEFLCTAAGEGTPSQILVYVNASTGAEEQLLLLISDENGQLTI